MSPKNPPQKIPKKCILEENNKITISYDYLAEKFSKEDILNINKGIESIIKQVINNENIRIKNIEV